MINSDEYYSLLDCVKDVPGPGCATCYWYSKEDYCWLSTAESNECKDNNYSKFKDIETPKETV